MHGKWNMLEAIGKGWGVIILIKKQSWLLQAKQVLEWRSSGDILGCWKLVIWVQSNSQVWNKKLLDVKYRKSNFSIS